MNFVNKTEVNFLKTLFGQIQDAQVRAHVLDSEFSHCTKKRRNLSEMHI